MIDITILNEKMERVSIIDAFDSLIWTDRAIEAGDFELYTYASASIFDTAKTGYYRSIPGSDYVMIIEDVRMTTDAEDGDRVIITGRSLESILDRRVVWSKTYLNGSVQDSIKLLINESIISPEDTARKIDNFVFDSADNEEITNLKIRYEIYGDNLYDTIVDICRTYNIYYRITNINGVFHFKLHCGVDRSYDQETLPWVVYSVANDNLISSEFTQSSAAIKNVALILGDFKQDKDQDGNYYGLIRQMSATYGDATGLDRKELFVDASSLSAEDVSDDIYKQYLEYEGALELADYSANNYFTREVETTHSFTYGTDYYLNDFVQFENQYGVGAKVQVTEYTRNESSSGYSEYPTFSQDYAERPNVEDNTNLLGANLNNWSFVTPSHKGSAIVIENEDLWKNRVTYNPISGWEIMYKQITNLDTTKYYTLSCEYRNITGWEPSGDGLFGLLVSTSVPTNTSTQNIIAEYIFQQPIGYSERASVSFKPTNSTIYVVINGGYLKDGQRCTFDINHLKLEEGSTPTVWSRKPSSS